MPKRNTFMQEQRQKKKSFTEARLAIQKYCAYQERCHQEVKRKLYDYGLKTFEIDELIADLIQSNYLNEERFARSFARGKSKVKKWGRNKILSELRLRKISDYCIRKAMTEIDDDLYSETLRALIEKKNREYKSKNEFEQRAKIARFLMGKGYESDLVWEAVKELV